MTSVYQRAQRQGQSFVRAAILDVAKRLLLEEGPAALTVRRISGEVGCSTKVIYTLFGGKDGLSEALWVEGFSRFERWLTNLPPPEGGTWAQLETGLTAYRDWAVSESGYYRVMFMNAMPGFKPSDAAIAAARRTFDQLVSGLEYFVQAGVLRGVRAEEIADVLWMAMHGAVSLEISGYFDPEVAEQRYRLLCTSVLAPYLAPDTPDASGASGASEAFDVQDAHDGPDERDTS